MVAASSPASAFEAQVAVLLGDPSGSLAAIETRVRATLPAEPAIVWEADAITFQFTYVSAAASELLGYTPSRWLEPDFWADTLVHPADRDDAIAYWMLATRNRRDHVFEYRAFSADGRLVWLRDAVQVIAARGGIPERLRGIMFDVTRHRQECGASDAVAAQRPTRDELLRATARDAS